MRVSSTVSSDHLEFLITKDQQQIYLSRFSTPMAIRWPGDHEKSLHSVEKITKLLPDESRDFFKLSLFSSALLDDDKGRQDALFSWLIKSGGQQLLKPVTLDDAIKGTWRTVPVVIVQGKAGSLVHFLVGALPVLAPSSLTAYIPDWATKLLTVSSQKAVADAISAVHYAVKQNTPVFCFPLSPPNGSAPLDGAKSRFRISGRSLGLSIGIGARSAILGTKLPDQWLATGDLQSSGDVHHVYSIQCKCDCARENEFSLFICPLERSALPDLASSRMEVRRVSNLDQACLWVQRYTSPDDREEASLLEVACISATNFVANCARLRLESIRYWCHLPDSVDFLTEIRQNHHLMDDLVKILEKLVSSEVADHSKARAIASLIPPGDKLKEVGKISPLNAFKWCSLNMGLVNHWGKSKETEKWRREAEQFAERAKQQDPAEYAGFINRYYVDALHNRYTFSTILPEEFQILFKEEEKAWRGIGINQILGAFYGTVAQNYAFCGLSYLAQVQKYVALSQSCFGGCIPPPSHVCDWRRGFSYLFGAYMDGGDLDNARVSLWQYLGADSWSSFIGMRETAGGDRKYAFYYLVRFLASSLQMKRNPEVDGHFLIDTIINEFADEIKRKNRHPWQLYSYNTGILSQRLGDQKLAARAWDESLRICLGGGETMQAMALLPLSALHQADLIRADHKRQLNKVFTLIRSSELLNASHFSPLLKLNMPDQVLIEVANHPEKYFPFNYR